MKYILMMIIIFSFIESKNLEYEKSKNIVIDQKNKLMWQDNAEVTQYLETYITAKVYCENTILNGYIDWRVPSIDELINIIDVTNKNSVHKKFQYIMPNIYSTNSTLQSDNKYIWSIDFRSGNILTAKKLSENYIRCVRDIL